MTVVPMGRMAALQVTGREEPSYAQRPDLPEAELPTHMSHRSHHEAPQGSQSEGATEKAGAAQKHLQGGFAPGIRQA